MERDEPPNCDLCPRRGWPGFTPENQLKWDCWRAAEAWGWPPALAARQPADWLEDLLWLHDLEASRKRSEPRPWPYAEPKSF